MVARRPTSQEEWTGRHPLPLCKAAYIEVFDDIDTNPSLYQRHRLQLKSTTYTSNTVRQPSTQRICSITFRLSSKPFYIFAVTVPCSRQSGRSSRYSGDDGVDITKDWCRCRRRPRCKRLCRAAVGGDCVAVNHAFEGAALARISFRSHIFIPTWWSNGLGRPQ